MAFLVNNLKKKDGGFLFENLKIIGGFPHKGFRIGSDIPYKYSEMNSDFPFLHSKGGGEDEGQTLSSGQALGR